MKRLLLPLFAIALLALGACRHTKPSPSTTSSDDPSTSTPSTTQPGTTTTQPDIELSDVALGFNNAEQGVVAPDGTALLVLKRLDSVEVLRRVDGEVVRAGGSGRISLPAITAGETRVVVAWVEGSDGGGTVVKAAVSEDSGRSFGPEQLVGEGGGPSLTASGDEVLMVWHTGKEGEPNGDIALARLPAGATAWEAEGSVDESAAAPLWASIDAHESTVVVTWRDNRTGPYTVWTRTSNDLGASWNPEVQVLTTHSGDPDVCIDTAGTTWLGYHAQGDVYLARMNAGETAFGEPARVGDGWFAHVSCDTDVVGVAWEETTSPSKAPEAEKAAGWAIYDSDLGRVDGGSEGAPDAAAATIVPVAGGGLELVWIDPDGSPLTGTLKAIPLP
ncbi:MAG: hypothetical protein IT198_10585 [Acidimicrobiia bacterium]|nr:hypothetical protein [Acidimicrobiia bacterium]